MSFWRNVHRWRPWTLPFYQLLVHLMIKYCQNNISVLVQIVGFNLIYTVGLKHHIQVSRSLLDCCGLLSVQFTRFIQDYFTWNGPVMPSSQCQPLEWRHNKRDGASNHRRLDCLLNRWFRRRSKKTSKLRVTGLRKGESTRDRWIPLTNGQIRGKCFY